MVHRFGEVSARIDRDGLVWFEGPRLLAAAIDPVRTAQMDLFPGERSAAVEDLYAAVGRWAPDRLVLLAVARRGPLTAPTGLACPVDLVDPRTPRFAWGGLVFHHDPARAEAGAWTALPGPAADDPTNGEGVVYGCDGVWALNPVGGFALPLPADAEGWSVEYPAVRR